MRRAWRSSSTTIAVLACRMSRGRRGILHALVVIVSGGNLLSLYR